MNFLAFCRSLLRSQLLPYRPLQPAAKESAPPPDSASDGLTSDPAAVKTEQNPAAVKVESEQVKTEQESSGARTSSSTTMQFAARRPTPPQQQVRIVVATAAINSILFPAAAADKAVFQDDEDMKGSSAEGASSNVIPPTVIEGSAKERRVRKRSSSGEDFNFAISSNVRLTFLSSSGDASAVNQASCSFSSSQPGSSNAESNSKRFRRGSVSGSRTYSVVVTEASVAASVAAGGSQYSDDDEETVFSEQGYETVCIASITRDGSSDDEASDSDVSDSDEDGSLYVEREVFTEYEVDSEADREDERALLGADADAASSASDSDCEIIDQVQRLIQCSILITSSCVSSFIFTVL